MLAKSVKSSTNDNAVKFTNRETGYTAHHLYGSVSPYGEFVGNSSILACFQITGNLNKYSIMMCLLEFEVRRGRYFDARVPTVNSNSQN